MRIFYCGQPSSIQIHIDELVLRGFAPSDRHRIARAVEHELARLIDERSGLRWPQSLPVIERINGGAFKVRAGANPQAVGTQVARAVYESLQESSPLSRRHGLRNVNAGKARKVHSAQVFGDRLIRGSHS